MGAFLKSRPQTPEKLFGPPSAVCSLHPSPRLLDKTPKPCYPKRRRYLLKFFKNRVFRSIFRNKRPSDRVGRMQVIRQNFFLHTHPPIIRRHALRLRYTWCAGGITAFLFLVEIITGILLMFYFRPTVEYAYHDILALRESVPFGILREVHRWAAHLMVAMVMLHMLRVFLTGSYKPPREFNWVIGVLLLVLVLFLSFTGYVLPWDQLAYWADTVGTNMLRAAPVVGSEGPLSPEIVTESNDLRWWILGGEEVSNETLNRFYILHCVALPALVLVLCGVHFWRVRKDGISGPL